MGYFCFVLVYWLSTNSRKMLYLRSSYYGSGILKKHFWIIMFLFTLRSFKHLVTHIILVVFVVQHVMNVSMVFHLLLIKNNVYFVYMIIISRIGFLMKFMIFFFSTYAPRCAKCTYPICPEDVRERLLEKMNGDLIY